MIVKILSSSASFNGVEYNTEKVDKGKGELMVAENFSPLEGMKNLRPEDYKGYLKLVSSKNSKVEKPQFHAVISGKGKEYNKQQLTDIGHKWLNEMGYGKNPFLIVYHKDTENNHVHLVSTRIDKQGKKIDSNFENIRAYKALNKIIGLDLNVKVSEDIKKSMTFNFKTKAQFFLLLERKGYSIKATDKGIDVIKFGTLITTILPNELEAKIESVETDSKRVAQLRAIIEKYKLQYSGSLKPTYTTQPSGLLSQTGYTSDLAEYLKEEFGVELVFHSKDNKTPYGFTIIDNAKRNVFKGGDVIKLSELIENNILSDKKQIIEKDPYKTHIENRITAHDELAYYRTLVRSVVNSYGLLEEGLKHQGFDLITKSDQLLIIDVPNNASISLNDLISDEEGNYSKFTNLIQQRTPSNEISISESSEEYYQSEEYYESTALEDLADLGFSGDDIDDEALLGRNRARKGMARTNTR
ncbi:hypothetical protein EON73_01265 [bacterium]|nr:MAG: hypothetical protein EON73_01265 [bacterium]